MQTIIVNYGMGNLGSVLTAIRNLGRQAEITKDPSDLEKADKVILPGVGSFNDAMQELRSKGWVEALKTHAKIKKRPILGICLGMQLFADLGFEGEETKGLSLIPGKVKHLNDIGCQGKVPHIGWNDVKVKKQSDLFNGISSGNDFYFVHSYAFVPVNEDNVLSTVFYEKEIVASIMSQNIYGTQFHPEKSSFAGQKLLKNFLEL